MFDRLKSLLQTGKKDIVDQFYAVNQKRLDAGKYLNNQLNPITGNGVVGTAIDKANNFIQSGKKIALPEWDVGENASVAKKIVPGAYNLFARPVVNSGLNVSANLGIDVGEQLVGRTRNAGKFRSPVANLSQRVVNTTQGIKERPQDIIADVGAVGADVSNLVMPKAPSKSLVGASKGVYGPTAQKAALKELATKEAKFGARLGTVQGASVGLEQGRNMSLPDQLKQGVTSGVTTGAMGAGLGAVTPFVGQGANEVVYQAGKTLENPVRKPGFIKLPTTPDNTVAKDTAKFANNRVEQISKPLEVGNKKRGLVKSVQKSDLADEIKDSLTGRYDKRNTKALADRSVARIANEDSITTYNRLLNVKKFTDEDVADAVAFAKVATGGSSGEKKLAADVLARAAGSLTEQGQAIQAASLLKKMTPEGVLYQIGQISNKKGKGVSSEVIDRFVDATSRVQEMPDGREKNMAIQQIQRELNQLFPDSLSKQLVTTWKAGLLTGLKTSGINISANTANAAARQVSSPFATAADIGMSLFTGKRTKTSTLAGLGTGIKKGVSEGWDYLINKYDPNIISTKGDQPIKGTSFSKNILGKIGQEYTDFVFRAIGAQDRPFYWSAMYNSLEDQARAEVKNQRISGDKVKGFIKNFVENPPEQAAQRAAEEAKQAVFQNDTALGKATASFKRGLGDTGEVLVPFAKTPSAVITEIANYTPVGPIAEAFSQIKKGTFDQRALANAIGKGATGTAILALGAELGKAGMINLNYPKTEREQTLWEAQNRKEGSIILGNTQIDLQSLGPAGQVLALGAAAAQQEGTSNKVGAAIAQAGSQVLESPFMQGVANISDIFKAPAGSSPVEAFSKYVTSQAGSVVPSLVSDIAQAGDRNDQGMVRSRTTEGPVQGIQNRLPGQRNKLQQSYDVYGNERTTGKNLFQTMADPLRSQTLKSSPILDEVQRLQEAGQSASPSKTDKTQKAFGQTIKLNKAEVEKLEKETGGQISQKFSEIMNSPLYINSSDEEKANALNSIVSEVRKNATKQIISGGTESLVDGLISKATEAKAGAETTKDNASSTKAPTKEELDLAKYQVESGTKSQVVLGDKVVRLDPDTGNVQVLSKKKISYEAETKKIDNDLNDLKDEGDVAGWLKLAQDKKNRLVEYGNTLDPELDASELETLRGKLDTLNESIAKYNGYGGFTKPKKAAKGPKFSSYTLDSSLNADTYKRLQSLLGGANKAPQIAPKAQKVTLIKRKAA